VNGALKRCVVAYATPDHQYLWPVDLQPDGTIADAIEAARQLTDVADVPWDSAPVGICGEVRPRSACPAEGDRVEIYRPLQDDPRERRRERVAQQRKASRR
jgi:hypothetical protein